MTTDNWIVIISAIIVAAGWFVTGYLNRLQDISQKRLEYRLEALKSFLPVWFSIQKNKALSNDPSFVSSLETARSNFQLYGYQDEIELMEQFITAIEQQSLETVNSTLSKLVPQVRKQIRKEIGLK